MRNGKISVVTSAARTTSHNSADFDNGRARGAHVIVHVSAKTATPLLTVKIQGKDAASGQYYTVLASTAIGSTGTSVLKVYPGITAVANGAATDILPATWRVRFEHGDSDSITYSCGANLVI